jgi:membrane-bound lytic murein transglycosylase A
MFRVQWHYVRSLLAIAACLGLSACATLHPGIGKPVSWSKLKGWENESLAKAWPAFEQSCVVLANTDDQWKRICEQVKSLENATDEQRRAFLHAEFIPHRVNPEPDNRHGLITGYYEPLLQGSRKRDARFRYAIYGRPDDLLQVDLGDVYPDLAGRRLRGRLVGKRVVPYYSREEIQHGSKPLKGKELLWVDDPVALFFLHIQGSGVVQLRDGSLVGVGYADQNGYPYKAIGSALVAENEIPRDKLSLQSIRDWLRDNPDKAETLMNSNPSYVFFQLRNDVKQGPIGTMGVPLTSERSIAVDRKYISLGLPVWLETTVPDIQDDERPGKNDGKQTDNKEKAEPFSHLVFAQDTGGAISGAARADLFWGRGQLAEEYAGRMKQPGKLFVLLPRPEKDPSQVADAR